jgi:hypothetical protein
MGVHEVQLGHGAVRPSVGQVGTAGGSVETPTCGRVSWSIWRRVLLTAQQSAKAEPVIAEAIQLYERKGNLVSAARARALGD